MVTGTQYARKHMPMPRAPGTNAWAKLSRLQKEKAKIPPRNKARKMTNKTMDCTRLFSPW
jgi:hypothetical protein